MKKTYLLLALILLSSVVIAQTPEAFKYQAVIRDNSGQLLTDQSVGIKIDILIGSTSGTSVYSETHNSTTSAFGLISLEVGKGTTSDDFSAIDWGGDEHFIQISLDHAGGTDYELMGASQLISVPYALHASLSDSTKDERQTLSIDGDVLSISSGNSVTLPSGGASQGGNFIVSFQGDITDAEADEILENEVGPNTKYIWVLHTTQLTTLNLGGITDLIEFHVENSSLTTLIANDLIGCKDFVITNSSITTVSLPALASIRFFAVENCENLNEIDLSNLRYAVHSVLIRECPSLSSLDITNYEHGGFELYSSNLSSLLLPNYKYAWDCKIENCPSLSSLDISNLNKVGSNFSLGGVPLLSSLTLNLESASNFSISQMPLVNTLDLSMLDSVANFSVNNLGITTISLPNIETATTISISSCSALSSIDISNTIRIGMFNGSYNALPSDQINSLLAQFVSLLPEAPSYIYLEGQTPAAPPTGQGITDRATLISNGVTVETD